MRFVSLVFLIIALCIAPSVSASGVGEHILPNGLKVLITEDHKSPLSVFQIWYRVGARDERSGNTGISHLLEHMMFKGTSKYGSKALSTTVQKHGGSDNAFTSKDYTAYFQILPSDHIGLSFDFESDRMRNLVLDEKETLSERDVVMEERRMRYENDPQSSLFEDVVAASFKVHPYRWPVIGWMSDLGNISRKDLLEHYRGSYCPGNAVVVIAGDVNPDEMLRKAGEFFSGIEPCRNVEAAPVSAEPPQRGERRVYLKKEAELPYILAAYHAPSLPHKDGFALDVLVTALSGKSGRLYKSLIYEKKIALNAFADYSGLNKDPYLFIVGGTVRPGKDANELQKALDEELDALKEKPLSDFELQKSKNRIEASFIMGQDSVFYQAMLLGQYEMIGDWRLRDKYLEGIRAVAAEDVMRVAKDYLSEDNRTVGILIPLVKDKPSL